jgi:hypothetical protein
VFLNALRPSLEQRGGAHEITVGLQSDTALRLGVLQLVDGGEMPIHQHSIGEGPEMFGWLQFWRIGWEEEQMEVVWHAQALGAVPARAIQHEDNLLAGTRTNGLGKGSEFGFKEGHAHRRRRMKDCATGSGMDKADEIAPFVAMLDWGEWTLVVQSPDFAQDRFQANAMLVHGPQLDRRLREGRRHFAQQGT